MQKVEYQGGDGAEGSDDEAGANSRPMKVSSVVIFEYEESIESKFHGSSDHEMCLLAWFLQFGNSSFSGFKIQKATKRQNTRKWKKTSSKNRIKEQRTDFEGETEESRCSGVSVLQKETES